MGSIRAGYILFVNEILLPRSTIMLPSFFLTSLNLKIGPSDRLTDFKKNTIGATITSSGMTYAVQFGRRMNIERSIPKTSSTDTPSEISA